MIFVTVGNHNQPFDRLLLWADKIARSGIFPEAFCVQRGHSKVRLKACQSVDFLDAEQFDARVAEARALVTHGGQGTIFAGVGAGLIPVVVPRLKRLNEHRNDHQLQIATALEQRGLVRVAHTYEDLVVHLSGVLGVGRKGQKEIKPGELILSIVARYLDAVALQAAEQRG